MSLFTISNVPDYSSIKLEFEFDDTSYDDATLKMEVFTSEDEFKNDNPKYSYSISGLTSSDESGKIIAPTDFDDSFEKFVDGLYVFTLTSYTASDVEIESISDKYIITYNAGVIIALTTLDVCRQLEEDDNEHLEEALWAIWGEILLIGIDRGGAVGLIENALNILDYTKKYLNE